jgi:cytidylate kinase
MAVITISREYGSQGDEIAARVCEMLGYQFFDKRLMAKVASEVGLAENEIIDFSEDNYKVRSFLDRLLRLDNPRVIARVGTWQETTRGSKVEAVAELDETHGIAMVQSTVHAAYQRGNVVIVGRGGQAILKDKPDVLHLRIEAPQEVRVQYLQDQENLDSGAAQGLVTNRDKAAAAYLKQFYDIDWADPLHYHLVINTSNWGVEAAAHLIVTAVSYLLPVEETALVTG